MIRRVELLCSLFLCIVCAATAFSFGYGFASTHHNINAVQQQSKSSSSSRNSIPNYSEAVRNTALFAAGAGADRAGGGGAAAGARRSSGGGVGKTRDSPQHRIKTAKVTRLLRDELSDIITSCDIRAVVYPEDKLLQTVSIVDIELSGDFSVAKVYISVFGNSVEKRQVYVWLNENLGQVRHSLCKRMKWLRKVPAVSFALADTQASFLLNDVMDDLAKDGEATVGDDDDIDFEEDDEDDDDDEDFDDNDEYAVGGKEEAGWRS
jgi:ribosome-binding factor A